MSEISDEELVGRAVRHAVRSSGRRARWAYVSELFACGRTVAVALCDRYGIDPYLEYRPGRGVTNGQ